MSSINLTLDATFGGLGPDPGQFNRPTSAAILNDELYVVDRQNHRIQAFKFDGTFVREFGSQGSGDDEFYFPEGITIHNERLYITDTANHRIKEHRPTGGYLSQFGTQGSGDGEFDYPAGIHSFNGNLWIVDRQNHRLVVADRKTGAFLLTWGGYGTGDNNLNYPEFVTERRGEIIVSDAGNKVVKRFSQMGNYVGKISGFGHPVGVFQMPDGVLGVCDRQTSTVYFYDPNFLQIGSQSTGLNFPYSAVSTIQQLFIVEYGSHQVSVFDYSVITETPVFDEKITTLSQQLYPTGRAWILPFKSVFRKLHAGLAMSESRALQQGRGIYNSLVPDNNEFTDRDAERWEAALGLYKNSSLSISDRKAGILRKMRFPGEELYRQTAGYLQQQLQDAGFDVYVEQNIDTDLIASVYGQIIYGGNVYSEVSPPNASLIANYVDEGLDAISYTDTEKNLRFTFAIGDTSPLAGNIAEVDQDRKKEFRELILKIKPAHTTGWLFINYV